MTSRPPPPPLSHAGASCLWHSSGWSETTNFLLMKCLQTVTRCRVSTWLLQTLSVGGKTQWGSQTPAVTQTSSVTWTWDGNSPNACRHRCLTEFLFSLPNLFLSVQPAKHWLMSHILRSRWKRKHTQLNIRGCCTFLEMPYVRSSS